jgi:hypothetical protein
MKSNFRTRPVLQPQGHQRRKLPSEKMWSIKAQTPTKNKKITKNL